MPLVGPGVVVFDVDDTLYLERTYAYSGFAAVGRWVEEHHRRSGFGDACRTLLDAGVRGVIFNEALEQVGVPADEALVRQLVAIYRDHVPDIELLPDARESIAYYHGRVPLAIISDGPHTAQQHKVTRLGLSTWFDPIVLTDRWGRDAWKPAPRAYQHLQDTFGVAAARCVYIGDNPTKDFIACQALGWKSVRVRRAGSLHEGDDGPAGGQPDRVVTDLRRLPDVVSELFSATGTQPPPVP